MNCLLQIFPENPEQQASLIEGVLAPDTDLTQFWELEQVVFLSQDLIREQTADEEFVGGEEEVKKVKWLHPSECKHFSWQPVAVLMVVVELSKLL